MAIWGFLVLSLHFLLQNMRESNKAQWKQLIVITVAVINLLLYMHQKALDTIIPIQMLFK